MAEQGIPYYSPHLNCAHFEVIAPEAPVEFWKAMGMAFVDHAWALLLLKGWEESGGTKAEMVHAKQLGIPTWAFNHAFASLVGEWRNPWSR